MSLRNGHSQTRSRPTRTAYGRFPFSEGGPVSLEGFSPESELAPKTSKLYKSDFFGRWTYPLLAVFAVGFWIARERSRRY